MVWDSDENNNLCEDNGLNILQCLVPGLDGTVGAVENILDDLFATIGEALEVLGKDCVLGGIGCVLNDTIWKKLLGSTGLGGIICGLPILGGILGSC